MDAVAIESKRRITEEHGGIGGNAVFEDGVLRRGLARCLRRSGRRRFAVDDGLFFLDGYLLFRFRANFVVNRHENQFAHTPRLDGDVADARASHHIDAKRQIAMEPYPPGRPHSARQRDRWQKPAACRVTIFSETRLRYRRPKEKPVPQRRQRISRPRRAGIMVERGEQRLDGGNGGVRESGFLAPFPFVEFLCRKRHGARLPVHCVGAALWHVHWRESMAPDRQSEKNLQIERMEQRREEQPQITVLGHPLPEKDNARSRRCADRGLSTCPAPPPL